MSTYHGTVRVIPTAPATQSKRPLQLEGRYVASAVTTVASKVGSPGKPSSTAAKVVAKATHGLVAVAAATNSASVRDKTNSAAVAGGTGCCMALEACVEEGMVLMEEDVRSTLL